MDIYATAKVELTSIDRQIAALQQRRDHLRSFVNLGASLYNGADGLVEHKPSNGAAVILEPVTSVGQGTTKHSVSSATEEILLTAGPMHTRDLVPKIEARGVQIPGKDKNSTVSVILSKSRQFKSDRKVGWSLVRSIEEATPQGAPTPAGSRVGVSPVPDGGPGQAAG